VPFTPRRRRLNVTSAVPNLRAHADITDPRRASGRVGPVRSGYLASDDRWLPTTTRSFEHRSQPLTSSYVQAFRPFRPPRPPVHDRRRFDTASHRRTWLRPGNRPPNCLCRNHEIGRAYTHASSAADPTTYVTATTPPFVLLQRHALPMVSPTRRSPSTNTLTQKACKHPLWSSGGNHGLFHVCGSTGCRDGWSYQGWSSARSHRFPRPHLGSTG